MACKLLYQCGKGIHLIGTFYNRAKAERFWLAVRPSLAAKLGDNIQPVYIETKGRT